MIFRFRADPTQAARPTAACAEIDAIAGYRGRKNNLENKISPDLHGGRRKEKTVAAK
jgi:hypothetical protein